MSLLSKFGLKRDKKSRNAGSAEAVSPKRVSVRLNDGQTMVMEKGVSLTPEQCRAVMGQSNLIVDHVFEPPDNGELPFDVAEQLVLDDMMKDQVNQRTAKKSKRVRRPKYKTLPLENTIRILTVEKGAGADKLRCRLQTRSIRDGQPFEALSYTWDPSVKTRYYHKDPRNGRSENSLESQSAAASGPFGYSKPVSYMAEEPEQRAAEFDESALTEMAEIEVDGRTCDITGNLAMALHELRSVSSERDLWVDQLCINQQNDREKAQQVKQMGAIYQYCDTVRIWLGPAADGSDLAFDLIQRIWDCKNVHGLEPADVFRSGMPQPLFRGLEELTILCMRPWFTRRWTVQELGFASKAIVHCGMKSLAWEKLSFAVEFLASSRLELVSIRIRDFYRNGSPYEYRRGYFQTLAAETFTTVRGGIIQRDPSSPGRQIKRLLDIETLLGRLRTLQSTKPHDTIYALIGLANDTYNAAELYPNYDKPAVDLYVDLTLWVIKNNKKLNIICRPWAQPLKGVRMPSWIQCYRPPATRHEGGGDMEQLREMFVGDGGKSRFNASADIAAKARMIDIGAVGPALAFRGCLVGMVEAVSEPAYQTVPISWKDFVFNHIRREEYINVGGVKQIWDDRRNAGYSDDMAWLELLHSLFADALLAGLATGETHLSVVKHLICEALFNDNSPYRSRSGPFLNIADEGSQLQPPILHVGQFWPIGANAPLPVGLVRQFLAHMRRCTLNRALARTSCGKLALVDSRVRAGDTICIPFGCDVPVVLREKDKERYMDQRKHEFGLFEFQGEAFIRQMMDGRFMTEIIKKLPECVGEFWLY